MAKIVYGVSGQGFGHASRSKEVLEFLAKKGHNILVLTYGQGLFFLKSDKWAVREVSGLALYYDKDRLNYTKTVLKNTKQLFKQSMEWKGVLEIFRDFDPDVVISDFEPMSALLAKVQRTPLISLDNQHQLTRTKIDIPTKYKNQLEAEKFVIRAYFRRAKHYLITSFFKTPVRRRHTDLFDSIIRQEVLDLKPVVEDFVLVYSTAENEKLIDELIEIDEKFIYYGLDREDIRHNIKYKKFTADGFLKDLSECKAVIGTAGLSLISEALYLKKPYFACPVRGQIEQVVNAIYLDKLGYGVFGENIEKDKICDFLSRLDEININLENYKWSGNAGIFRRLEELVDSLT